VKPEPPRPPRAPEAPWRIATGGGAGARGPAVEDVATPRPLPAPPATVVSGSASTSASTSASLAPSLARSPFTPTSNRAGDGGPAPVPAADERPTPQRTTSSGRTGGDRPVTSSGLARLSGIFRFSPTVDTGGVDFRQRRGLRWRLSVFLIVATLVPVMAVAAVSIALAFSSVDQGLEYEARRGLQLARALFLQEVRDRASAASLLGGDAALLAAVAASASSPSSPSSVSSASASALASARVRQRVGEISEQLPTVLFEVTEASGRVLARCAAGSCDGSTLGDAFADFEAADHSPVVRRALEFERSVSIESAGNHLAVRAALPLVDPALKLLGAAVVSARVDGPMVDQIKAELGTSRDVVVYAGSNPTTSTFLAPTGERLTGPPLPVAAARLLRAGHSPVVTLAIGGRDYSVAFGPIQDVAGRRVGLLGIALDRETVAAARQRVTVTLLLGAVSVLLIALGLADLLARRLTRPLRDLHTAALSIANGNLQTRIEVDTPDELGDVASAFRVMIKSLRDNQERLAARVRELVTVHQVGRAVSSVVDLDLVLRSVASESMAVLGARTAAIALPYRRAPAHPQLDGGPSDPAQGWDGFVIRAVAGQSVGKRLAEMAQVVAAIGTPRRARQVELDPELADAARSAGIEGPVLAAPLVLKDRLMGVILVGRLGDAPFSDADLRLLVTLADQTASAIENARLYSEVRAFSENLELKVRERTLELERSKAETEEALRELRAAQAQLIHSERMAGLGQLVAGIAHEVNSPAAAVQGSLDALHDTVERLELRGRELHGLGLPPAALVAFFELVDAAMKKQSARTLPTAVETRLLGRRLQWVLQGLPGCQAAASALSELGPDAEWIAAALKDLAGGRDLVPLAGYLRELAFLVRTSSTIRTAIQSIRRIVGALRRYSRLDEAPTDNVDLHAGIEDTLVILAHLLKSTEKGINVERSYGDIPPIQAYVGELNQVWTNLIHNAVQAMGGTGEILIETSVEGGDVRVAIQDNGPGIRPDVMSRIFEPFFTTKGKGEGTGLGLSIAHRIVEKHAGRIRVQSAPGRTRFEVELPISQSQTQFPTQPGDIPRGEEN